MKYLLMRYLANFCGVFFLLFAFSAESFESIDSKVGLNKYDLLRQYLGTASNLDGDASSQKLAQAMARKAISDAGDLGVTYFRIAASGYSPTKYDTKGDLDLWIKNPDAYWHTVDLMFNDLKSKNIKLIPNLMWNVTQFPSMTHETTAQLITDSNSNSYKLLTKYITQFVTRYGSNGQILFYELANELNLIADLDAVSRCKSAHPNSDVCQPIGNFSTDQLVLFNSKLTTLIHRLDSSHLVSSGYSVPRPAALHLKMKPEWSQGGPDWTKDNLADFEKYLEISHNGVDIVSVHLYFNADNQRFGSIYPSELLDRIKSATDKMKKPLFVGEFGGVMSNDKADIFTDNMLKKIVLLKVPYSAVWVWEFYQKSTYETRDNRDTAFSLEPGVADEFLAELKRVNQGVNNSDINKNTLPDSSPPRVVLTWPLDCQVVQDNQKIYAVASDDQSLEKVEFWQDNQLLASEAAPPYQAKLKIKSDSLPITSIKAIAYDKSGNTAEYITRVITNKSAQLSCSEHAK